MRHRRVWLVVAILVFGSLGCATLLPKRTETQHCPDAPALLSVYYTWYSTAEGPHGVWAGWGPGPPSQGAPSGTNPSHVLPDGMRDISSCAYPLVGLYNSDDAEVVRWHIRLAKAAGIDAFLVDWWGPGSWQAAKGLTHDAFVDVVLPVAEAEDFKVCLFDETAQFVRNFDEVKEWAALYLARFKDSPAYLHIDGKPVYAVYQVPFAPSLSVDQAEELRSYVEKRVGPVYWIFDKIANGTHPETGESVFVVPEEWLGLHWIDAFMGYGTFSVRRVYKQDALTPLFEGMTSVAHVAGHKVMLPIHPGHDNSKLQEKPWVIPRQNGVTLQGYLEAAQDARADMVLVTSFNEWPETTIVEPSSTWPDPYLYLRILAQWRGTTFVPPPLPPSSEGSR